MFDDPTLEPRTAPISTRYGWLERVNTQRVAPPKLSYDELRALNPTELLRHDRRRAIHHANITIETRQIKRFISDLDTILEANLQDAGRVRSTVLLDAQPGLGKTTASIATGARVHRREVELFGPETRLGLRLPVLYISLTANTTMKMLNRDLARFYDAPGLENSNANQLVHAVGNCIRECETRLIIIDDIHFLNLAQRNGRDLANHLKWLNSELPSTILYVGVNIAGNAILRDGLCAEDAQISRRTTAFTLEPFTQTTEAGQKEWHRVLRAIEERLILANLEPGTLSDELSDYLFERSTGRFASLMSLLARGCANAIASGTETLTKTNLDKIRIDYAAELARHKGKKTR